MMHRYPFDAYNEIQQMAAHVPRLLLAKDFETCLMGQCEGVP